MTNAVGTEMYAAKRKGVEKFFAEHEPVEKEAKEHLSPSGNYKLIMTPYDAGKGYWNYTMGVVLNARTDEEVSVVLRNYGSFPFRWVEHPNGNEYLFCGEDYQGYNFLSDSSPWLALGMNQT